MTNAEAKPWHQSDEDRLYEESVMRVKNAVLKQSMPFQKALELIDVADEAARRAIGDDALKVMIAELHFVGGKSVADLARSFKLSQKIVEQARKEMLQDVKQTAIDAYKAETGQGGNA
jgi:hypothetical protein